MSRPRAASGDVAPPTEDRDRMRVAVQRRMTELRIDQAELIRRTGKSGPTIRKVLRAEGGYDDRTKYAVCAALGWSPDSIDRLLAGRQPVPLPEGAPPFSRADENGGAAATRAELDDLRREVVRAGTFAATNTAHLEEVLRAVGELRDEVHLLRMQLEAADALRQLAESAFDVAP